MENTNTFALITPKGALRFDTGVPVAMRDQTDPHFHSTDGFQVVHLVRGAGVPGMRGHIGGDSANYPDKYEPNPVAEWVVVALAGRPLVEAYGNLTLCGHQFDDDGEDELAGLTAEQQHTILAAHIEAMAR